MADTIKIIIVLVMISVFFHLGNVAAGKTGWAGDDMLNQWVNTTQESNNQFSQSTQYNESTTDFLNQNSNKVSGTSFFNFWDWTQIAIKLIRLAFNIVFAIPYYLLLDPSMPYAIKIVFVIPLMIISTIAFMLGIIGRR